MKVRHLDCGTMQPRARRLLTGRGSPWAVHRLATHCLVVEASAGLVLVDTGLGLADCAHPRQRLGELFVRVVRPVLDPARTAARQLEALGYRRRDVRHVAVTHLDVDHAGGLADFPEATVHVLRPEHEAATGRRGLVARQRYRPCQWAHGPRWQLHDLDGERFEGWSNVTAVVEPDVLLVPLAGHSPGHAAVAVRTADQWLVHCGDAYFDRREITAPERPVPPGLAWFERALSVDEKARRASQRQLGELCRTRAADIALCCSHDPEELARLSGSGQLDAQASAHARPS